MRPSVFIKSIVTGFFCTVSYLCHGQSNNRDNATIFLNKDSVISSLDGYSQDIYYYKSTKNNPQPLIVQLHSWSYTADSLKTIGLDAIAKNKNYNYLFPNFRGVNNHAKACCSEFVLADLDEAIDWALKNMNVDKHKIYVVGYSGGGYATLAMYMKSRHTISAFSAWASISDLTAWYKESVERKNKYAAEIIKCTGADNKFDSLKAKERSPLAWKTPVKKRKKSTLQIFAGIHDGHNGAVVPISQSINFYNKIVGDYKEKELTKYVSDENEKTMLTTQTFPVTDTSRKLANRLIYYQNSSKKVMLTIFEGGHELLSHQALEYIEKRNGYR